MTGFLKHLHMAFKTTVSSAGWMVSRSLRTRSGRADVTRVLVNAAFGKSVMLQVTSTTACQPYVCWLSRYAAAATCRSFFRQLVLTAFSYMSMCDRHLQVKAQPLGQLGFCVLLSRFLQTNMGETSLHHLSLKIQHANIQASVCWHPTRPKAWFLPEKEAEVLCFWVKSLTC